jgi:hypothetical protein
MAKQSEVVAHSALVGGAETSLHTHDHDALNNFVAAEHYDWTNETHDIKTTGTASLGTNPAASGRIRIPNNSTIVSRNAANSSDVSLIYADTNDRVVVSNVLSATASGNVNIGGSAVGNEKLTVTGRVSLQETTAPSNTAGYGKLYVQSSDSNLYFKNSGGTAYQLTPPSGGGSSITMIILSKSSSVNQNVGGSNGTEVWWTWDGEIKKDSGFIHSNVSNSSRIQVEANGWYEITFVGGTQTTGSARTTLQGIFRVNGGATSRGGSVRAYMRGSSYGNGSPGICYCLYMSAGSYIEIGTRVEDTDQTYTINTSGGEISDDCHFLCIKKVA